MRYLAGITLIVATILRTAEGMAAGLPCLGGVCLGAKLAEVKASWESPDPSTLRARDGRIAMLERNRQQLEMSLTFAREAFPGITDRTAAALSSLGDGYFYILDQASQPIFLSIPRYCRFIYVTGVATSPSGNPMQVTFTPTATGEELAVVSVTSNYDIPPRDEPGRKILSEAQERFGGATDFRFERKEFTSRFIISIYDPKRFTGSGQLPFSQAMTENFKTMPACLAAARRRSLD